MLANLVRSYWVTHHSNGIRKFILVMDDIILKKTGMTNINIFYLENCSTMISLYLFGVSRSYIYTHGSDWIGMTININLQTKSLNMVLKILNTVFNF